MVVICVYRKPGLTRCVGDLLWKNYCRLHGSDWLNILYSSTSCCHIQVSFTNIIAQCFFLFHFHFNLNSASSLQCIKVVKYRFFSRMTWQFQKAFSTYGQSGSKFSVMMNISISFLVTCTLSATAIKSIDSADMQLCKQDGVLSLVTIFCTLTLSQGSTVVYHGCCKYLCKLFTFSVKLPWLPLCRIHFCNVVRPVLTADLEETSRLQEALSASKLILNHVDHAVRECENRHKLADLQTRLDTRQLENSTDQVAAKYKVSRMHYVLATRGHEILYNVHTTTTVLWPLYG